MTALLDRVLLRRHPLPTDLLTNRCQTARPRLIATWHVNGQECPVCRWTIEQDSFSTPG